jgi:DNA-binding Lrp family transcriptional regulator
MTELDATDRVLLEHLQARFPLAPRPFSVLAEPMELDEAQVLERTRGLKAAGMIREISAIFDTRRLGYESTLVAFHVPDAALEAVADKVSAHSGVSHNYARPHYFNLWFTLAVPPGDSLASAIERLATEAGVDDWLNLPALRVFKIKTHFSLQGESASQGPDEDDALAPEPRPFTPADIPYVRALQEDLDLVAQPYARAASRLGLSEDALLARAHELKAAGIMRRIGAVLRHRRVGFAANGMACWVVPQERMEEVGNRAAEFPQISHCYQRPSYPPRWPYSLFTMIHGQAREEVEAVVSQLVLETGIKEHKVLYSTREFKKARVRYFEEAS